MRDKIIDIILCFLSDESREGDLTEAEVERLADELFHGLKDALCDLIQEAE